jgi:hypothetical protein
MTMAGSEGINDADFSDVTLEYTPEETGQAAAPAKEGEEEKPAAGEGEGEGDKGTDGEPKDGEGEPGKEPEKKDGEGEGDDPLRDKGGKAKSGVQGRIDQLTALYRDAQRRAARAEAMLSAQDPSGEGAPKAKPDPKEFPDYGDYVEALSDWKDEQREREKAGSIAKDAGQEADQIRGQIWSEKVQASKAAIKDFDAVVGKSEIELRSDIVPVLMEADKGPELLYHLAQNPDLVARLNDMSPARAAMEMGRIEKELGPKAPPPKTPSKAPAPIEPVRPGSSTSKSVAEIDDMDEYVAKRKAQGAGWSK